VLASQFYAGRPVVGTRPPASITGVLDDAPRDEARILRLLYRCGPQPAIDLSFDRAVGRERNRSRSVLTIAGREAGCQDLESAPMYLGELLGLGLIKLSHRRLRSERYRLLETEPQVVAARERGIDPLVMRASIELTSAGKAVAAAGFSGTTAAG
jgi:hypothetical protein